MAPEATATVTACSAERAHVRHQANALLPSLGIAGGALWISGSAGSSVTFTACVFRKNGGNTGAGVLHSLDAAAVLYDRCVFIGNEVASFGGSLYLSQRDTGTFYVIPRLPPTSLSFSTVRCLFTCAVAPFVVRDSFFDQGFAVSYPPEANQLSTSAFQAVLTCPLPCFARRSWAVPSVWTRAAPSS
jgi:hypothetical protein